MREINIPAQRGEIFDSKYSRALVSSKEGFAIDIIPGKVPIEEFPLLFENLSKILKIDIEQLQLICANKVFPISMKDSVREAFLDATYDPLDTLLASQDDVNAVAAKLGYS